MKCKWCQIETEGSTKIRYSNGLVSVPICFGCYEKLGDSGVVPTKFKLNEVEMKELTEEQKKEFETAAKVLIKYLCENHNPHVYIRIDSTSAELVQGIRGFSTDEFVLD